MKKFNFDFNLESIKESIMEMDTKNKVILGVSAFAVVGVLGFGGYALANNLGGADTNSNKVAVSTEKNETPLGVTSESEKEDAKKKEETKEETKKEDSKENKDSNKKEDTKETSKKEESKESDSKTEEKKESSSTESTTSSNTVNSTPSTNNQSSSSSSTQSSTQSSKPSTNSTSKPSNSGGNSSSSNTQQSKPQETPVVEEKPVVEQKPVEQKPVVEEKPSTPSWWGEGKSEAEIMKTVTDALVWKNEITGETYYGLNGLKFGWNADNATYGGLVLVSNPYNVIFFGYAFTGGWANSHLSTSIEYMYENYDGDEGYQSQRYYFNISAPEAITFSEMLALYGM